MRLGPVSVVSGTFFFDQVFHADDLFVSLQVFLAGRRGERKPNTGALEVLKKLARLRKRLDPIEELRLKDMLAQGFERLFYVFLLPPRNEHRDQLVAALANLATDFLKLNMDAQGTQRDLPCFGMKPVALHQRSIDITENSFYHFVCDAEMRIQRTRIMMTIDELNAQFGLDGVLVFEEHNAMPRLRVNAPAAKATVYLQGAHLTDWEPAGQEPVLFLSGTSDFADGKAIRGGVPICFPWFGPRWDGEPGPAHGFARIQSWEVVFAALVGEDVHLSFVLRPSDLSRSLGYDDFHIAYELVIGRMLRLRLSVANSGSKPLVFEEALHTYFNVADVRSTRLEGLESALYLDKTDGMQEKETPGDALVLVAETDRVFPENVASVTIRDEARQLTVDKSNSATTVVWNPWESKAAGLRDLEPGSWTRFVCVETVNSGVDRISLPPSEVHTMQAEIYVQEGRS